LILNQIRRIFSYNANKKCFSSLKEMQKAKKNHSTSITNLPYISRSDLFFHAPTTKYSLVHILFFLLDILVSFELRVHSIDSCSCTKIDANHYFCRLKSIYACATSLSTDFNTIGHNKFLLPINGQSFLRFFLMIAI